MNMQQHILVCLCEPPTPSLKAWGNNIRRRHLLQEGWFLLVSGKTQSWNGFWGSQRALWLWQTWKYHRPLSAIKSDNFKKKHHQDNSETIRAGLKVQDPASYRVLSPIMWHEIRRSQWKIWKSVFQTNDTKELKTQGAKCQGPAKRPLYISENKTKQNKNYQWQCVLKVFKKILQLPPACPQSDAIPKQMTMGMGVLKMQKGCNQSVLG